MVKVKICLDTGCTRYILLDNGTTIETPRANCEPKVWNDNEKQEWQTIVKETQDAVKINKPMFQTTKVGDEVNI